MAAGISTPGRSPYGNLPAWVAFGAAFGVGWFSNRQSVLLSVWQHRWHRNLVLAVAATLACLVIHGKASVLQPTAAGGFTPGYAACYSLATWGWTMAVIGMGMRFFSGYWRVRRFCADASCWVYLIHLPIIMVLQVLVAKLPWHWAIKFPLILGVGFGLMCMSHHLLVRKTVIG